MRVKTPILNGESVSLGPGSYEHSKFVSGKKPPAYSMGVKNWRSYFEKVPGPGTYETDRSTVSNLPSSKF